MPKNAKKIKVVRSSSLEDASYNVISSIITKRSGKKIKSKNIEKIVTDFVEGKISESQMSAWLATIASKDMEISEIISLTRAYIAGGKQLDLKSKVSGVVDKHSTGGVGDKVSLIVVPIVAACGVPVAKISGRGLGHAGGTLDKLDSVRGINMNLSPEQMQLVIDKVGMSICGQSPDIVPGDKSTYLLRDATGSVESMPLIAASIMSKKIAIGTSGVVLDIKFGSGSLIKKYRDAKKLAELMIEIGSQFGMNCKAVISDMNQPLGFAVGNALEIKECIEVLRGRYVPRLVELCKEISSLMLQVSNKGFTSEKAEEKVDMVLKNGAAYLKLLEWFKEQGAEVEQFDDLNNFFPSKYKQIIQSSDEGWIGKIDAKKVGEASLRIGAGRLDPNKKIDHAAGIVLTKQEGDYIKKGEIVAEIHYNSGDINFASQLINKAFVIQEKKPAIQPIVHCRYW